MGGKMAVDNEDQLIEIHLNEYQRANLLHLLDMIYMNRIPELSCLNTGDWVGEVWGRLTKGIQLSPNMTLPEELPHQPNVTLDYVEHHFHQQWVSNYVEGRNAGLTAALNMCKDLSDESQSILKSLIR
jgi:hypothetical protein